MRIEKVSHLEKLFEDYKALAVIDYMEQITQYGWTKIQAYRHAQNFPHPENFHLLLDDVEDVGEDLVGFLDIAEYTDVIILNNLIIAEQLRGKGYGSRAIEALKKYAGGRKIQSFYYNHNEASRALHAKHGFKPIGEYVQLG